MQWTVDDVGCRPSLGPVMMVIRVMMVLGMLSASPPTSCLSTCVVRGDDGKDVVALSGVPTGVGGRHSAECRRNGRFPSGVVLVCCLECQCFP